MFSIARQAIAGSTNLTMTKDEADPVLAKLEADNFSELYRSRRDRTHAATVVPLLLSCLEIDDLSVMRRSLSALHRIGPEAP